MAPDADPYRTLGLERDASLDDVKRAYRRLAKANHPDAAGEAALPRFLAIQAAYDQIAGPDARTRRPGAAGSGGARRAWEADPDRAGATHRAYGGRPRTRPGPRARPGPPPGPRASRPPRTDRPPNKATLGSTSYDGAEAEPLDPDWGGASWYGTSSGTYWTLNPKEYADPRKHGPEYQARARRADERRTAASTPPSETLAADAEPATVAPDAEPAPVTPDAPDAEPAPVAPDAPDAEPAPVAPDAPTHTASSWWQPTASDRPFDAPGAHPPPPAPPPPAAARPPSVDGPDASTDAILDSIRLWLEDRRPGVAARVGRAVVGWAPIGLGLSWATGEATGCSRFSADCSPAVAPITWGAQLAVLVLLIAAPRFSRVATVATIATLAAVFPASALLLATSDPASMDAGRAVLGGLMAIAWVAGIAYGAAREFRQRPIDGPVS